MGHIVNWPSPVSRTLGFPQVAPSRIGLLLDMTLRASSAVLYFESLTWVNWMGPVMTTLEKVNAERLKQ